MQACDILGIGGEYIVALIDVKYKIGHCDIISWVWDHHNPMMQHPSRDQYQGKFWIIPRVDR